MDWKLLIENCETDLRAANIGAVAARLREIKSSQVPRKFALPMANICRRSGMITQALRILGPVLMPNRKNSNPAQVATPQESAEYAVCLQRFGAVREAIDRLDSLDFEQVPEALLYRAFCDFNQWRYADAIPLLQRYLRSSLDSYSALVGRTNLAAAMVADSRLDEGAELLSQNISEARRLGVRRLEGNSNELRAQIYLQKLEFGKLNEELCRAEKLLQKEGGFESSFVQKWRAAALALSEGLLEPLHSYRLEALRRQDWENVRDSDRFLLKAKFDSELFTHLWFGSPNGNFRERLQGDFERKPEFDFFTLGTPGGMVLDVRQGTFERKPFLEPGQKLWQLFLLLSRDFYKPVSTGELFSNLYPGERFNVFSSPARVHQLLTRLRAALRAEAVPIEILEFDGSYTLKLNGGLSLILRLEGNPKSTQQLQMDKIMSRFPAGSEFTSQQAAEILDLPETTLRRFLRWGIESGRLRRFSAGYNTKYMVLGAETLGLSA